MRIVLYAEGAGDGARGLPPPPGSPLAEEALGAAHVLVRRCLEADRRIPTNAIQFESPLRAGPRVARGSDLLLRDTLRRLLTWLRSELRPDVAIVLVDADGESARKRTLEAHVADLPVAKVIAIAVQEFEAWLIADHVAVGNVIGTTLSMSKAPESMERREAKSLLTQWLAQSRDDPWTMRRTIAERCSLDELSRRCEAFDEFRRTLARTIG